MMNSIGNQSRLDFVRQQMAMYSGAKKEVGSRMMVICPYHAENTPSGSVNIGPTYAPGYFRCFACGAKAKWDDVAPKLGLEPYKKGPPKEEHSIDLLMSKGLEALETSRYEKGKFKFMDLPRNKKWRTIPTNLLIELGGRLCRKWSEYTDDWSAEKFIYLPVNINGETEGYFLARLKKVEDKPSYLLAKAINNSGWSISHGLWPFDHAIELMVSNRSRTVVLVEGQRDALRLLLNGIPALCIFGTQSWSDSKAKLLEIAGVETVITLFDGDCAGIQATQRIAPQLKTLFTVKVLKLWAMKGSPYLKFADQDEPSKAAKKAGVSLWDPGNMPQRIIDKIKARYF